MAIIPPSGFWEKLQRRLAFSASLVVFGLFGLGCGMGSSDSGENPMGEFILAFLGGAETRTAPPSQLQPSPLAEDGSNTPVFQNPPDEVLATNPPPPTAGDIVPMSVTGEEPVVVVGPKIKLEIDHSNYTAASQFSFGDKQVGTQEDRVVRIENVGDRDLVLSYVEVEGSGNQFRFVEDTSVTPVYSGSMKTLDRPTVPGNGGFVQFFLRFNPNAVGRRMGILKIQSNDPNRALIEIVLEGSGTATPTARVLKPATAVSRFQRVVVEFSHAMDKGTVCNGAVGTFGTETYSHRTSPNPGKQIRFYKTGSPTQLVSGRCTWTGNRQLVLQPYDPLEENQSYTVDLEESKLHSSLSGIADGNLLYCLGLPTGGCHSTKKVAFLTEPAFRANLSINGKKVVGSGSAGLVMNRANHGTVTLSGSIDSAGLATYRRIKKVGSNPNVYQDWNGTTNVNLTTIGSQTNPNHFDYIRPTEGSNGYYVEILYGGKLYIRNFGFNWGTPQGNPTQTAVANGGRVNIGDGAVGVGQIARLLEKFIQSNGNMVANSGNFLLDGKNFDEYVNNPPFLSGPLMNSPAPTGGPNCNPGNRSFGGSPFSYLMNFGPFCNISFSTGGGCITGRADAYILNLKVENTGPTSGTHGDSLGRNVKVIMNPRNDRLDINLEGRRLVGKLRITVHSGGGWCFGAGALANGTVRDLDFRMNAVNNCGSLGGDIADSSCNYNSDKRFRISQSRTSLTIPSNNGLLELSILNPPWNIPDNSNFNIKDWDDDITAYNLSNIAGSFGGIVNMVLDWVLPAVKWRIVQGVIRDFIQTIAPNVLNALFSQLRIEIGDATPNGIGVNLPGYLPDPFNRTKLFVGANLRQNNTNRTGNDGLDLPADIGILACMNPDSSTDTCLPSTMPAPGSLNRPALHTGTGFEDSFILDTSGNRHLNPPKSQLAPGLVNGSGGSDLIQHHPGVLLTVKMDVINQVLYNLWKKGIFELSLDQQFANQVKDYRGDQDRLFQIFQILLKADALLQVLAPGQTDVFYGPGANDKINRNDGIIFKLKPFSPPNVKPASLAYSKATTGYPGPARKFPMAEIEWSDLIIEVWGKRSDNSEYKITTLKINFKSRAGLNIHRFSSPVDLGSGAGVNNYQNVTSIQLNVCDDNVDSPSSFDCDELRTTNATDDDLVYTLEVLDNDIDNPLGLDPRGIYEVLNPSVQKLILPVVNFVLEELPLEEKSIALPSAGTPNQPGTREDPNHPDNKIMANCGIRLENMSVLPIPETETNPYILIHTQLHDYTFSGNCQL